MNSLHPNIQQLEVVAEALGDLCDELILWVDAQQGCYVRRLMRHRRV